MRRFYSHGGPSRYKLAMVSPTLVIWTSSLVLDNSIQRSSCRLYPFPWNRFAGARHSNLIEEVAILDRSIKYLVPGAQSENSHDIGPTPERHEHQGTPPRTGTSQPGRTEPFGLTIRGAFFIPGTSIKTRTLRLVATLHNLLHRPNARTNRTVSHTCNRTADEHCFVRGSDSDARDTAVDMTLDCLNSLSFPTMVPFPSLGILACSSPAVLASTSSAELPQLLGHGDRLLSGILLFHEGHSRTNQVLGRECHSTAEDMPVSMDLVSDFSFSLQFNSSVTESAAASWRPS